MRHPPRDALGRVQRDAPVVDGRVTHAEAARREGEDAQPEVRRRLVQGRRRALARELLRVGAQGRCRPGAGRVGGPGRRRRLLARCERGGGGFG